MSVADFSAARNRRQERRHVLKLLAELAAAEAQIRPKFDRKLSSRIDATIAELDAIGACRLPRTA